MIALLFAFALFPIAASAHKPIFEDKDTKGYEDSIKVPDPDVSFAVYGFLDHAGDVDYYYFDVVKEGPVYTEVIVPKRAVYENFRPSYAIVGPGITDKPQGLPFEVREGWGALVIDQPEGVREEFYEPFGGETYYMGKKQYTNLTPGRYYVVVFDKQLKMGDYVLAVGEKESFGLFDIINAIFAVIKIRLGAVDHSGVVAECQ